MRRQDILVSLLYCVGFSKVRNLLFRWRDEPVTRVITFHDIPDNSIGSFEANVSYLQRHTNVISLDDFMRGKLSTRRINVVITFDDGYRSWVTRAQPVLKRLRLPATFFVSSGFVGLAAADQVQFARSNLRLSVTASHEVACLSVQDVRELVHAGFTIGGHTSTHADLAGIDEIGLLMHEVVEDKRRLEQVTGQPIDYFAYPFGSFRNPTHHLLPILAAAGYKAAMTTIPGFNTSESDSYRLNRELITAEMSNLVFRARVWGNTDGVQFLRRWLMQLCKRWRLESGQHVIG